jgi:hypothetical protein
MLILENLDRIFACLTRKDSQGNIPVPELVGKSPADLRLLHFSQEFMLPAGGTFAAPVEQGPSPVNFAAGAIILGISGDAIPDGQPVNPWLTGNERYEIQIDYTQGDRLMTGLNGGFQLASGLFGRNGEKQLFPEKVLYMPPQQNFFTKVRTRLSEPLYVTIDYATLEPIEEEPEVKPWGLFEMVARAPDGLALVFAEVPPEHPLRRRH